MSNPLRSAISWLGFSDPEAAQFPTAAAPVAARATSAASRVTSLRPSRRGYGDVSEILTFQPKTWKDSRDIAEAFRMGTPVIINMVDVPQAEQVRLLDFILGLQAGLEGNLKRVTQTVFLLTPTHVAVNDEEDGEIDMAPQDDLDIRRPY